MNRDNELVVAWYGVPGSNRQEDSTLTHITLNGRPVCGARLRRDMQLQFVGTLEAVMQRPRHYGGAVECERCAREVGIGWYVVGVRQARAESYGVFASYEDAVAWRKSKADLKYSVTRACVGRFIRVAAPEELAQAARLNKAQRRAGDGVIVPRADVEE